MSEKTWIEEQKALRGIFRGGGRGNDADRMLEKSPANRSLTARQNKLIITCRTLDVVMGTTCMSELCDYVEYAQLVTDAQSRKDFMRVAIEQWQAKLATAKKKAVENLL